ncbi:hypothetical protein, conserved [Trypanosoma brucei brucei TREU927]|uniref:Defective in cullin neddylation protein n=1 Tax=Trypanosoma brucei brucei (strain 927/4 GUTat10.1) TaxID=185431 RepID=Q57US7_TRYB2|nr:hypothetical protein, conserved [Trypanosoma brucei brucei TREU927]AAX70650.1 hypothetical protein, conserved [Trypanosoma brucei]AAZ10639.1 hypothetical protein, conserved [Trypanosoma brucei brucei TREU927]
MVTGDMSTTVTGLDPHKMARRASRFVSSVKASTGTASSTGRTEMERYFENFASMDSAEGLETIGPKGIQHLCEDLAIKRDSFEMYTLIWKLGITRGGCIPRSDWLNMVYNYNIEVPVELKRRLREWVKDARGPSFVEFYSELYDYIRGDSARMMLPETAARAWDVLFRGDQQVAQWIRWYTGFYDCEVTRDIWRHVALFFNTGENATPYRKEDAWPTAFDLFAEWRETCETP